MRDDLLPELGFYGLAGGAVQPRQILDEVRAGEALGLGAGFISERFNAKEAASLSGAVGAVTTELGVATAATNHNTRHPLITGSFATTLHRLTEGRFALGLGRGVAALHEAYGLRPITTAQLEDTAGLLRRLWAGEAVFGHDGPAGAFPILSLDASFDEHIPLLLVAFGPQSLALGGRAFDAVVLHTFFDDATTARCVAHVRQAAEEAGRDPASVRIWSCLATVPDRLDEPTRLKRTVGRLATYLQGYPDLMVRTNRWDPAPLERFRADPLVATFPGAIDALATTEQLEHIATLLPDEWLAASATGSPAACAATVAAQFDLGVDSVILHGSPPDDLASVVDAYRSIRRPDRHAHLPPNPGWADRAHQVSTAPAT